jgi:PhzF family phenazine biosynthesis protein
MKNVSVLVIYFYGNLFSTNKNSVMKTSIVDSFTNEQFKGNPAGVCFPEQEITAHKMQLIARELGLSETAFLYKNGKTDSYAIRYFSPKMEIPLCGHATLASAKVLFKETNAKKIQFTTIEDLTLTATRKGEEITMEFPVYDTEAVTVPPTMLKALGLTTVTCSSYSAHNKVIVLEIPSTKTLAELNPDFNALVPSHNGIHGVLVTASARDDGYDYHYRFFWPWAGTNEDPVTGGVQTFLAKYWSQKLNKKNLKAFQSSGRTGYMNLTVRNDSVLLTSRAVIMFEGNFIEI